VFTAEYFCVLSSAKYRVKAAEPFSIFSREARKTAICNRQHTESPPLLNSAARSPHGGLVVALLLDELHVARNALLQNFFTVGNFERLVPSQMQINCNHTVERRHAIHVMRAHPAIAKGVKKCPIESLRRSTQRHNAVQIE